MSPIDTIKAEINEIREARELWMDKVGEFDLGMCSVYEAYHSKPATWDEPDGRTEESIHVVEANRIEAVLDALGKAVGALMKYEDEKVLSDGWYDTSVADDALTAIAAELSGK